MEGGQFVRIEDVREETLSWIRPNFFALHYELVSPAGLVESLRVRGIGPDRHVLVEAASGAWSIKLFPMDRPVVPIFRIGDSETEVPVAEYDRRSEMRLRLSAGTSYELRSEGALRTILEDAEHRPIFTMEQVEAFPRWRVEVKLTADAVTMPELPVVLAAACCSLVFTSYRTARLTGPEIAASPTMTASG